MFDVRCSMFDVRCSSCRPFNVQGSMVQSSRFSPHLSRFPFHSPPVPVETSNLQPPTPDRRSAICHLPSAIHPRPISLANNPPPALILPWQPQNLKIHPPPAPDA